MADTRGAYRRRQEARGYLGWVSLSDSRGVISVLGPRQDCPTRETTPGWDLWSPGAEKTQRAGYGGQRPHGMKMNLRRRKTG